MPAEPNVQPLPLTPRRDVQGPIAKFGIIGPATNTIVQPDYEAMRPLGVTNHYSRIRVFNPERLEDGNFIASTNLIGDNTIDAVKEVLACLPDRIVMGMSALTFYGGMKGALDFERQVRDAAGLPVSIGSLSLDAALGSYGGVRRVAFVSPYYPSANAEVARFLGDAGYEVKRDIALRARNWTGIAEINDEECRAALRLLDGDDVDALIQVGTNLSMVRLAAAAELWLGKPVIAINTATYWHALRQHGIYDRIPHLGRLLVDF